MDKITRAMLGDRKAQEEFTNMGKTIPCPSCYSEKIKFAYVCGDFLFECAECGTMCGFHSSGKVALAAWNTRAPILTPEQIERLED